MSNRDGLPPRIDASRPPPFHEMNEKAKAFERMTVSILMLDGRFKDARLYGVGGAPQYGIDALARVIEGDVQVALSAKAWFEVTTKALECWSDDFLKHYETRWKAEGVKVLVVATAATNLAAEKIQDQITRERARFAALGLTYEIWGPERLFDVLRRKPVAVRQFLGDAWVALVYGTGAELLSEAASDARAKLNAVGIPVSAEALLREIASGNADNVGLLLEAGLSPNVLVEDVTPLRKALELLDAPPGDLAGPAEALAVLKALVRGPQPLRGLGHHAHLAVEARNHARFQALLGIGIEADVPDAKGSSLAAKAMRADNDAGDGSSTWTELVATAAWRVEGLATWMMCWAARSGRSGLVRILAARGVSTDGVLDKPPGEWLEPRETSFWHPGGAPLHFAVASGPPMLRQLLSLGASTEVRDRVGRTPLHVAAEAGEKEVVDLLLRRGAAVSARDASGLLPLDSANWRTVATIAAAMTELQPHDAKRLVHRACHDWNDELLRSLLSLGADPEVLDDDGRTPLLGLACWWDRTYLSNRAAGLRCAEALLAHGADVTVRDRRGSTILHSLASSAEAAFAELMVSKGCPADVEDSDRRTVLMFAADCSPVDLFLGAGASLDARDRFGYAAVDYAAMRNSEPLLEWFSVRGRYPSKAASLVGKIHARDEASALSLLAEGAPADATDVYGSPVLDLASRRCLVGTVEALLLRGVDVNRRAENGDTALGSCLHWFDSEYRSWDDFVGTVRRLLEKGARVDAVDSLGRPALFAGWALWRSPELTHQIMEMCANTRDHEGTTVLMVVAACASLDTFSETLRKQPVLDEPDERGRTALFHAINSFEGAAEKVELLLGAGADPEVADIEGWTPLHLAAALDDPRILRALLSVNVSVDAAARGGETPLLQAVRGRRGGNAALLLEAGARADMVDASGRTPLEAALENGDVDIFSQLLAFGQTAEPASVA